MIALLIVRLVIAGPEPIVAAAVICGGLAIIDLVRRRGDIEALGVQIRLFYTLLLVLGLLPGMGWVHWMQLVGTSIRVLIGYCMLERELRLTPWNLIEHLTWRSAWQIATARPTGGLVRFGECAAGEVRGGACAMARFDAAEDAARTCAGAVEQTAAATPVRVPKVRTPRRRRGCDGRMEYEYEKRPPSDRPGWLLR